MKRIHLFEFEDLTWLPKSIRDAGTDLLRLKWEAWKIYTPIVPRLKDVLLKAASKEIVDLGSGGGGPTIAIYRDLAKSGITVSITLTDKFPNLEAFKSAKVRSNGGIDFIEESVDATAVPPNLSGLRTMFLCLHHFSPDMVRLILKDAVLQQRPIAIFDFSARTLPPLPIALLGNPLGVLLEIPFVRPFKWTRILWTYLLPIVPFFVTWDGLVSGLRLYSVRELREIVDTLPTNNYLWDIRSEPFPHSITHLIGYPGGDISPTSI